VVGPGSAGVEHTLTPTLSVGHIANAIGHSDHPPQPVGTAEYRLWASRTCLEKSVRTVTLQSRLNTRSGTPAPVTSPIATASAGVEKHQRRIEGAALLASLKYNRQRAIEVACRDHIGQAVTIDVGAAL